MSEKLYYIIICTCLIMKWNIFLLQYFVRGNIFSLHNQHLPARESPYLVIFSSCLFFFFPCSEILLFCLFTLLNGNLNFAIFTVKIISLLAPAGNKNRRNYVAETEGEEPFNKEKVKGVSDATKAPSKVRLSDIHAFSTHCNVWRPNPHFALDQVYNNLLSFIRSKMVLSLKKQNKTPNTNLFGNG